MIDTKQKHHFSHLYEIFENGPPMIYLKAKEFSICNKSTVGICLILCLTTCPNVSFSPQ